MRDLHSWTLEPAEAIRVQATLRERLVLAWDGCELRTVGGVDVSIQGETARAAIVVLSYPELALLESATADVPLAFPYIPGLLTFREGPAILAAWQRLGTQPDLLMFDGQGIAHPRGIGIAAQMGLWLERPSMGVAKSWLYGVYTAPGSQRGDAAELRDPRDPTHVIGQVLRTRTDVKPVYVSPGHLIDVPHSVEFALACCTRYRLPEPTRRAHQVAGGLK
ncbi:MAG: endonuclease V [Thermoflexales bacterium]|nr:endonuclease V [Thermoflexales bacterium]